MLSADNFVKQFGLRSGPTKGQAPPPQMSGLFWIQIVWHSDGIPERIFQKCWFWKKSADDKKHEKLCPADVRIASDIDNVVC